ncbi:hypothetical protein [Ensifer sp.]|jgi:hypothetical protein|nr:hypothetical protein [Ensifer sp.]
MTRFGGASAIAAATILISASVACGDDPPSSMGNPGQDDQAAREPA